LPNAFKNAASCFVSLRRAGSTLPKHCQAGVLEGYSDEEDDMKPAHFSKAVYTLSVMAILALAAAP